MAAQNGWQYSATYPRTAPTLELAERKGLSEKEQGELLEMLTKKAGELVGEVMVYELVVVAGQSVSWFGMVR